MTQRPTKTTCEGCGDPDVPVQERGSVPRFCFDCAGPPRNKSHNGWTGQQLWELRDRRRRERLGEEHVPSEPVARPGPEPTGRPVDPHAEDVVEDQQAAQAYWSAQGAPTADLQAPDGPIQLNQPVDYDPTDDDLLRGFEPDAPATPEHVGGSVTDAMVGRPEDQDVVEHPGRDASVCIAPGCALPDPGHGHDLFCRGHWRLISLETRQRIIGAPEGSARNGAVIRGLKEIRRSLGG